MKSLMNTYQVLVLGIFILLSSCSAQHDESKAYAPSLEFEEATAMEEAKNDDVMQKELTSNATSFTPKKWRKKAQQQLETLEDLIKISQDQTLEKEFKTAIEEELHNLYSSLDSNDYFKAPMQLKFKHFSVSDSSNNDTIRIDFKNKKDNLSAFFLVNRTEKQFGNSSELVEEIELITIKTTP